MPTALPVSSAVNTFMQSADQSAMQTNLGLTAAGVAVGTAADEAAQRTALGLGSIATQAANAVAITGGSVALDGVLSTSVNGAASTPAFKITGTPYTAGSATTNKALALIETSGATSTAWSTAGTMLGVNAPSGFTGNLIDAQTNGTSYFNVTSAGVGTFGNGSLKTVITPTTNGLKLSSNIGAVLTVAYNSSADTFVLSSWQGSTGVVALIGAVADPGNTNRAGYGLSLVGGAATGNAHGGDVMAKTSNLRSSGTTQQSYSTRSFISSRYVDLTESTATLFANVGVASGKYAGFEIVCTVTANDGTDYQSITSRVLVDALNKAGTVTASVTQVDNTTAASSGTLTATYTAVANGNSVDIKCNAVSSLAQTALRIKWAIVCLNSDGVDTGAASGSLVTPQ